MNKKILVTGAAGFLGGRTAKFLSAHFTNYDIIATSRRDNRAGEFAEHNCTFIPGDLCDIDFCESITNEVEVIIHCAALSSPYGKYEDFYQSNFIATQNLINSSIKNKVQQFIFISTPSIYFNFEDRFDVNEEEELPKEMVNHYAATKLMAEELVLQHNGSKIKTLALRPRAIIGAEDTVIFPRVLEAYHQGKLKIVGNGKNKCDFTCVRNVIEAIICSVNAAENAYGKAYNITDGKAVDFWETLNYALSSLGLKPPTRKVPKKIAMLAASILEGKAKLLNAKKEPALTKYGVGILMHHFTLDISRAKKYLNYKPVMTTYEGINEYILWHKNQQ